MHVELLLVEECPHADASRAILTESLRWLKLDVPVTERVGQYPSPTILVDNIDVMTGETGAPQGHACRLDIPTKAAIHAALRGASQPTANIDVYPAQLAVGVTRDRVARVSPAAREIHRAILHGFAASGRPPSWQQLRSIAARVELGAVLAELHDGDVVRLDGHGEIRAAYPFSAAPTTHVVTIAGGASAYAMCAIDALGMAAMLNRDIAVRSVDPQSGTEIQVTITGSEAVWDPATAVVLVGSITPTKIVNGECCPPDTDQACAAPAADRCCGVINFFTSTSTARIWLAAHPDVKAEILTQGQALRLGNDIFGQLLDQEH